ncbi:hypothetical protein ANCCAN_07678 [Ancylostoma caninum]|uniref:Uncharacterized protein n=1 Tax=Ancylostoma caninum TaxID=29170 RepID=A0A368GRN9_ANCCA|nr:hypothetical protein ANCCAN_07678 [Ancylostoma caninum]
MDKRRRQDIFVQEERVGDALESQPSEVLRSVFRIQHSHRSKRETRGLWLRDRHSCLWSVGFVIDFTVMPLKNAATIYSDLCVPMRRHYGLFECLVLRSWARIRFGTIHRSRTCNQPNLRRWHSFYIPSVQANPLRKGK